MLLRNFGVEVQSLNICADKINTIQVNYLFSGQEQTAEINLNDLTNQLKNST